MSAKEELIAAALRLAALAERNTDDRNEWQHAIDSVREGCARAMVRPDMVEVERLIDAFGSSCNSVKKFGHIASFKPIGQQITERREARAALLAHIQRGAVPEGWKEATIAWEVCASIHREYAKKKDPFFTTRQADFVRRTEAARAALLAAAPDNFRDAAKMVAEPVEVPMPQGYVERPSDYTGDIWIESQMRTYGDAREAAGYMRGLAVAGRDAERYRWLRDVSVPPHNFYLSVPDEFAGVRYTPTEVDAAIDAVIDALHGEVRP